MTISPPASTPTPMNIHLPDRSTSSAARKFTLLLPIPSHSSTPQLAADVLIHSFGLIRCGFVGDGRTVVPFVGPGEEGLVTGGMELYGKDDFPYLVIQQRSPVLKSQKSAHINLILRLLRFFPEITDLLILVGADDSAASSEDFLDYPFRVVRPPSYRPASASGAGSGSEEREEVVPTVPSRESDGMSGLKRFKEYRYASPEGPSTSSVEEFPPFIPGGGIARRLLDSVWHDSVDGEHGAGRQETVGESVGRTRWAALVLWCAEGDNRGAAIAMARMALRAIGQDDATEVELREPPAWKGLFGGDVGQGFGSASEIYG